MTDSRDEERIKGLSEYKDWELQKELDRREMAMRKEREIPAPTVCYECGGPIIVAYVSVGWTAQCTNKWCNHIVNCWFRKSEPHP